MGDSTDHFARRIMSGEARGIGAALLRAGLSIVEPFYAGITLLRNRLFDFGVKSVKRLPHPVISIGNITTGGTGKTPMVRWLAARLRDQGHHVAILSRGYKSSDGGLGDELTMLDRSLNGPGAPAIQLRANPNRATAGAKLLSEHPEVDVILLDDGFQHRRIARDLDVVLINATEPFGFDHVLPRGLLREPLGGLARASAIVLTRCDRVDERSLVEIERRVCQYNPTAPLVRSVHCQTGFRELTTPAYAPVDVPMTSLRDRKWFAFTGIGGPEGFKKQLESHGGRCVGTRPFGDHHEYAAGDLAAVNREARNVGADVLVTTEKDWVKVAPLWGSIADPLPVWRVEVEIQFLGDGASVLNRLVDPLFRDRQG